MIVIEERVEEVIEEGADVTVPKEGHEHKKEEKDADPPSSVNKDASIYVDKTLLQRRKERKRKKRRFS